MRLLFIALLLACLTSPILAADVSLAWDPSVSSNVAGYKVYFGNTSRTYGTPITIGNQTTYTVTGLGAGIWYFAVTAYAADGSESDFSNEVYTILGTSPPNPDLNGDGSVNVLDLQLLANAILQAQSPTGYDLNQDNSVNVLDLQILCNTILGI